ncbi:hypothetical protein P7K49_020883, partial [Saguinus oedipus]
LSPEILPTFHDASDLTVCLAVTAPPGPPTWVQSLLPPFPQTGLCFCLLYFWFPSLAPRTLEANPHQWLQSCKQKPPNIPLGALPHAGLRRCKGQNPSRPSCIST